MKARHAPRSGRSGDGRRGAALMLAMLVLFVLLLIVFQISISTGTDARVARNEDTLVAMDLAIESALLQVYEDLTIDGEADAAAGQGGGAANPFGGGEEGEASGPSDSRRDDWAQPQRTELNDIRLRILIQDEDSKLNLLTILTEEGEEAEKAMDRVARVIENSRKGTAAEIDGGMARRMAEAALEFMTRRTTQLLPRPELLSDDSEEEDIGLLLSLRELVAADPELFTEDLFRDYRDERDQVVHSLGTFLTVWTGLSTADEASAPPTSGTPAPAPLAPEGAPEGTPEGTPEGAPEGTPEPPQGAPPGGAGPGAPDPPPPGVAVNVNTAPPAVLKALVDDRDVPFRFWDDLIEYRNEPDESLEEEEEEPMLDEFGEELEVKKIFESMETVMEVGSWNDIEPLVQAELQNLLKVDSQVFSIFVTARKPTARDGGEEEFMDRVEVERREAEGEGIVRTVRSVVWRRVRGDGSVEIVPIVRWEVIDYVPYEVLDDPDERYTGR